MRDAHDQTVIRVAELYASGICLNIFGLNDHDPYQAITVPARPLKVGNPLIADTLQLPLEDWSVSRLIHFDRHGVRIRPPTSLQRQFFHRC
jgi:hypothetical protein